MAETFGVKLKSKDGTQMDGTQHPRPGCKRSEFKTKPVSDLKAMFDKPDGDNRSKAFSEVDTNVAKTTKATTVTTTTQKTEARNRGQMTVKTETVHTKLTKTNSKPGEISNEDKKDFEALAIKLKKTGVGLDALDTKSSDTTSEIKVAVAKTYSGGKTYQATVGSKLHKVSDKEENPELNRNTAASIISFGLTKLRVRPGSIQKQDGSLSRGNSIDEELGSGDKTPSSPRTVSPRSNSPINKDTKFIPGAARGWKSKADDTSAKTKSIPSFSESSVGKIRNETTQDEGQSNKIPGFRSVSPVLQRKNSSDDSSTNSSASSNLSPRGYKPAETNKTRKPTSAIKTDENKNLKNIGNVKRDVSNVFRENDISKSKKDDTKEGINEMKKMFEKKSGITTKLDSNNKGKGSPKGRGDFRWVEKGRISLEEFKQSQAEKTGGHKPLSRASSSGSNSSMSRRDSGIRNKALRFNSPEPQSDSSQSSIKDLNDKRQQFNVSRKMSVEKFLDIKHQFEGKDKVAKTRSQSPSAEPRKKLEIKPNKKIIERKQSFEGGEVFNKKSYEKSEIISPRDKGNVLATIKSLNELDAKAKAQPTIIRRTQSLPSDSFEDENDSSVDYYEDIEGHHAYYQDILGIKMGDDASNEGDISSEADLLYEEIPANLTYQNRDSMGKKDFQTRRATAFRKRKKTNEDQLKIDQTSTEGDIDSDTDSSNSGIYEPIDHDELGQYSESDSVDLPPELPPLRNQQQQKKKKKKEEKGSKGLTEKFKQLYKGKNKDSDSGKGGSGTGSNAGSQSTSVLGGLGDKLKKNLKKSKNNSAPNLQVLVTAEDNPVCESDSDTDIDLDKDINSKRSSLERSDEVAMDNQAPQPPPPRLPPRHSALHKVPSGGEMSRLGVSQDANVNQKRPSSGGGSGERSPRSSPRSPPRSPRPVSSNVDGRSSPPLPPRSRISNNLDLSMVIPIAPGGGSSYSNMELKKGKGPAVRDSYLHSQKMSVGPTSPELPYIDDSPQTSPDVVPPLPRRPLSSRTDSSDSYVDVDGKPPPPVPNRQGQKKPLTGTDSYVDVGDDNVMESEYSLADEIRKELEKRPVSSAYIKPYDLSTIPEPKNLSAPFEDVLKFRNEYDEDGLYIDLSDEQVYGTIGGTRYKSKLESEDLYQFYQSEKITRASKRKAIYSSFDESDEESYEEDEERVYEDLSEYSSGRGSMEMEKKDNGKNKISTLEMFGKKGTVLRTLWAEMPEVKSSGVLDTITPHERKLQEAMFEIITSEATYLKSLNVLIDVFLMSEEFGQDMSNKSVLTRQERHVVFSNIGTIRDTSERFLADLEAQWQKSVMLNEICDIITKHASQNFECYVHYCSNQTFQDRHITTMRKKMEFAEALRRLESHSDCQGLPMISFLLLPMQRITRLPLLVDAICHRLDPIKDKVRHKSAINAFNAMSKVVKKCNDGAKKMQQTEQMCLIAKEIAFSTSKEIPSIPLISASRFLVKQGEVTKIVNESSSRIPFGKAKPGKQSVHLFLFNDILLVTKKKGSQYIVTDYTQRNSLDVEMIDNPEKNARVLPMGTPSGCKNLFLLVILENFEKKQVEAVFSCSSTSDRARWVDAFTPVKVTDDQRIYEEWDECWHRFEVLLLALIHYQTIPPYYLSLVDVLENIVGKGEIAHCPQIQCVKKFVAMEPDELTLDESDVVNVFKKLDDGMYEGERIRDGERGWFPRDHTIEIVNSHVRQRNLRMKYRIMAATEGYGSVS